MLRRALRFALVAAALPLAAIVLADRAAHPATPSGLHAVGLPPIAFAAAANDARPQPPARPASSPLAGLDLARIGERGGRSIAPVEAGTAHLTLDASLQHTALMRMNARHLPEAAVVVMDVATGRLLVYASHAEQAPLRDLCAEATAPSASVFKIVTAAALVEQAHLGPETTQCYLGGEQRIGSRDLVEDSRRDKWCTTLAGALGRSINAVFARLANTHLAPEQLEAMARRFGYGAALPFDVPVQPSELHVPSDPLEFARTAAGFWNTTLSPLLAAEISAVVARGGERVRASIVEEVAAPTGAVVWSAPDAPAATRAITADTADKLTAMMERTVSEGTSRRAFHDARGASFLPGVTVAGKTGTLTDAATRRYYTWFTGFAPTKPTPGLRQVAISVLVVNGPTWQIKANVLAREMLQAYFGRGTGESRAAHPDKRLAEANDRERPKPREPRL